jgi:ribonuclease HI
VAFRGRHTRSHPQLPLATPETDPEVVLRKGKAPEEEAFTAETGNPPSPSVRTPFSPPQSLNRPPSEVSHFLNFGSVPAEFSPPGLGLEGEILVTPLSSEAVPWRRPTTTEDFPTPAQGGAPADLSSLAFSLNPLLFPTTLRNSFPVAPSRTPSPPSSPPPNIPMAGANPPMTDIEVIIAARYAPLVLPQPLNALPPEGYLKQLPRFTGEGDITAEEHLAAFYTFADDNVIMHADIWMRIFVHSLQGEARKWFKALPLGSIDGIRALDNAFLRQWGDKKDFMYYMTEFGSLKRKEGESVSDFSKRFNKMYNKIPAEIKPSEASAKITYSSAFDPDFCLLLRERRAATLAHMQDAAVEVESNILAVNRLRNAGDRNTSKNRPEASSSSSSPLPHQTDETARTLKSLAAKIERLELEGKPMYRNPQNNDNRGFRRPANNMPRVFPREQRGKDREDQRVQAPLQNNLVDHEEREEIDEFGPEIHCIEEAPPFPHLTQSAYEESLMSAQIHELGKEQRAGHTSNRYNLRSRRKEGDFDSSDQPLIADRPTKTAAATTKEKKTQSASPAAKEPVTEVREAPKPTPSFNFEHEIQKIRIPVPLSELVKNEDFKRSLSKLLQSEFPQPPSDSINLQDEKPAVVLGPMVEDRDDSSPPFYTSLNIHDKVLHNCLMDSGASHNLMLKIVMEELGLEVTRAYHDLYSFDSRRVQCLGVIKDLAVSLFQLPMKSVVMDIVVADVPPKFGMLLSRSWIKKLGGTLQMDLTYATIPVFGGEQRRLYREAQLAYIVSDEADPTNHPIFALDTDLGSSLLQLTDAPESSLLIRKHPSPDHPISPQSSSVWKMFFDGASSSEGAGAGVVFISPCQEVVSLSYKLEFETTNNVAEYEALVLGMRAAKEMGIEEIAIFGDAELIIQQVRNAYRAHNPRLRNYRNEVWDLIDNFFLAFNISFIPRGENTLADSLAVSASLLKFPLQPMVKNDVDIRYRPSVPDNVKHWKVFEDDSKLERFLQSVDEFSALHIDQDPDLEGNPRPEGFVNKIANHQIIQLPNNHIPRGLVPLERLFDGNDVPVKFRASNEDAETTECNIGTPEEPKFVKLSSSLTSEQRAEYTELLREFADVFAWTYEDLKTYDTSVIEHKIPLKEEAKPFRQKLRQINPMLLPIMEKEVKKLLDARIIVPLRYSEWVANLVPVRKKSGEIRLCVDFRNLNRSSKKDNYPLPKMEHILQRGLEHLGYP